MMMPDAEIHSSVTIQPSGEVLYSKGYVYTAADEIRMTARDCAT